MVIEAAHFAPYPHGMTQMPGHALFVSLLALSVLFTAMPMPAVMATAPAKSNCCARAKVEETQNDCGKHAPKSQEDRQCCVSCANCLTLYLPSQQSLNFSPSVKWILTLTSISGNSRAERPPVPPPRTAVV